MCHVWGYPFQIDTRSCGGGSALLWLLDPPVIWNLWMPIEQATIAEKSGLRCSCTSCMSAPLVSVTVCLSVCVCVCAQMYVCICMGVCVCVLVWLGHWGQGFVARAYCLRKHSACLFICCLIQRVLTRQEQRRAAGTGGDGCGHTHGENIYFLPGDLASRLSYPFFCLVGFQIYILGSLYGMAGERERQRLRSKQNCICLNFTILHSWRDTGNERTHTHTHTHTSRHVRVQTLSLCTQLFVK